jgi:hypothetical protein
MPHARKKPGRRRLEEHRGEREWKPPAKSDQPPGEHVVQVNDAYAGGKPPEDVAPLREQQHPHGG